jgi:hypothetical protein
MISVVKYSSTCCPAAAVDLENRRDPSMKKTTSHIEQSGIIFFDCHESLVWPQAGVSASASQLSKLSVACLIKKPLDFRAVDWFGRLEQ